MPSCQRRLHINRILHLSFSGPMLGLSVASSGTVVDVLPTMYLCCDDRRAFDASLPTATCLSRASANTINGKSPPIKVEIASSLSVEIIGASQ